MYLASILSVTSVIWRQLSTNRRVPVGEGPHNQVRQTDFPLPRPFTSLLGSTYVLALYRVRLCLVFQ